MAIAPRAEQSRRIVVVSPHFDDAVLSLGASIARWAREGAVVEVLTVLGCDPGSGAPSGGWDRRGGFATEGEAARDRRAEDLRACAFLGATSVALHYGSVDYERHGDEADVRRSVSDAIGGADVVLLPGFPLTHPDHAWLVRTLGEGALGGRRLQLYAEQPYARRDGRDPDAPNWVVTALGGDGAFERAPTGPQDRVAKWRAIRCYRSQLALLGMHRSVRGGAHRYAAAPEWVAHLAN